MKTTGSLPRPRPNLLLPPSDLHLRRKMEPYPPSLLGWPKQRGRITPPSNEKGPELLKTTRCLWCSRDDCSSFWCVRLPEDALQSTEVPSREIIDVLNSCQPTVAKGDDGRGCRRVKVKEVKENLEL
ncbi:unnamed protein product [Urochloa humidicola]